MTQDMQNSLNELELLAYADGLLDTDPARKASVERRLEASPADAERVRIHQAQNLALRRAYDARIDDPVPARFYGALEIRRRTPRFVRAAAAVVMVAAVGVAGWMLGSREGETNWSAEEFIEQSYVSYSGSRPGGESVDTGRSANASALQWLSQRISLSLKVPDMSAEGYVLTDRRTVTVDGGQFVRLSYKATDGRIFDLILQPRWEASDPGVRVAQRRDVSLAYWFDGPLAHAVVSNLPPVEARKLAIAVRDAMHDPDTSKPAVKLTPRLGRGYGVAGADASNQPPTVPAATEPPEPPTDPGRRNTVTN